MAIKIPLFKPCVGKEEADSVRITLESGWLGMGPKTKEFEERISNYVGVKGTVALNSCTAALNLTLELMGIGQGDEVIVPTITFIATAHAVVKTGATPIFADVEEDTLLISFDDIKKKITPRTKAIIVVHLAGRCVDVEALKNKTGLPIIEDAAHALGSSLNGKMAGNLGDVGCFSFHATKNITTGDGGAITCNDMVFLNKAKKVSWLGINQGTWNRVNSGKTHMWDYDVDKIGLKTHMNDVSASIGLIQLNKLNKMNARRKEVSDLYFDLLDGVVGLPVKDSAVSKSSWHIFCVRVEKRDELFQYLFDRGILTGVHYKPIHLYKCYGNIPSLPIAERVWESILSLPIHPGLTDQDVEQVADAIKDFIK